MADDGWLTSDAISTAAPAAAPAPHDDADWKTSDAVGTPAAPTTSAYEAAGGRSTWEDVLQGGVAGLHSAAGTAAGAIASTSDGPQEAYWRDIAKRQVQEAGQSEQAMTPAAQAPGFTKHPLVSTVEAIPGIATIAAPAAAANIVLPGSGAAVAAGLMGLQTRGDVYNRLTGEGAEPTSDQLTGATALGVATGLATGPIGEAAGKIATSPIARWALGGTGDTIVFGASSGAQEYSTQKDEIAAGKRKDLDPSAILEATKSGAEQGFGFSVMGGGHSGAHRDPTQTPGRATVPRVPDEQRATESKERAKTVAPKDVAATGPAAPANPASDPTLVAGAKEAPVKTPANVTRESKQQADAVQQQSGVVQPGEGAAQQATEAQGQGATTGEAPSPSQAGQASPAPAAAPPAPVDPAVLAQQHAELTDPAHPRDAMVYPKGVEPTDITTEKGRYGSVKLPGDGGTAVFKHDYGQGYWTKDKIKAAAKDGSLQDKIDAQASKPSVAEAPTAAAGEAKAPPAAAAEATPGVMTPERIEAIKAAARAQAAEREQPTDVQPTDVQPMGGEEVTHESTLPADEKLGENKFGVSVWRKGDGTFVKRYADGKPEQQITPTVADLLTKQGEWKPAEASEADKIRDAAQTEAERLKLAREKVATLSTKDAETGEEISKPLPEAGARVLRADDEGERARGAAQEKADREAAEKVATEKSPVKVVKAKEDIKGSKDLKRNEAQAKANAIAGEIVDRHPPKDIEAKAIDPSKEGGKGARAALMSRVKEMVEDAKGKYEFLGQAKHRTVEEARHSNKALVLYEAKLLLGKGAKAKTEDYMRFLHNEHRLLTGGHEAYEEVMGLRKQTGREIAAERGKGVKEGGVEDIEATKGTEAEETADEAHERELTKGLEAKRAKEEELKELEAKEREDREKEDKRQAELKAEADLAKRALPAEPEIISPARAKLMDADKAARERIAREEEKARAAPAERAPIEAEEGTHYTPVKETAGFKVEKRRFDPKTKPKTDWKKENDAEEMLRHAGWTDKEIEEFKARSTPDQLWDAAIDAHVVGGEQLVGPEAYLKLDEPAKEVGPPGKGEIQIEGRYGKVNLRPSKVSDARTAIKENYDKRRYEKGVPQIMDKLRDLIVRIAGDTKVYYIDSEQMKEITGSASRGAFNHEQGIIVLNVDNMLASTPIHEAYHAAIAVGLRKQPHLRDLMEKLRQEVLKNMPKDMSKEDKRQIAYYLDDHEEFVNGIMTHPLMQSLLKGVKISADLAREIGIPRWRKMTMWEGALGIIRKALGLGPRDTSAIEAAMSLSEEAMWQDPSASGDLMQAAGRLASAELRGDKWWKQEAASRERDQETFLRTPTQSLARVRNINRQMTTEFGKDKFTNLSASVMRGAMKILSGTWMQDVHGHLFEDEHGPILQTINRIRDAVHHMYSQLMDSDKNIINRGYMLDKQYASYMGDYARLINLSNTFNIHADRDAPATKEDPVDEAHRNWQRNEHYAEASGIYDRLPEALQKRYRDEKRFYTDKQGQTASVIINKVLPLFAAPKGSTLDEVMTRARANDLTDEDWQHYEKLGIDGSIRQATRLMNKRDVYFNAQRDGRYGVSGHYEMPEGGSEKAYSGEELPNNKREFDTEKEAHGFVTGTHMHATTREIHYWTDKATGETKQVPHDFATHDQGTETVKYQVRLETQNTQFATTPAEAQRNRQAMAASGVGKLSGVFDRRNEAAWSKINSADQSRIERKINSNDDLTDMEKQHMRDISRQMMLAGQGGMSAHMIQARKVAGAKFDTAAGLHAYARAVNFHMAREAHAPQLDDAMTRLDNHEDAMGGDAQNSIRRSMVASEMRDRVYGHTSDVLNSKTHPIMHRLMTWAFVNFLARPSHIFLSQIHPWIYSVPMMGARHGIWKAGAAQRQAMKDLGGVTRNLWEGAKAGYDVYKSGHEKDIDKAVQMAHGVDPIRTMISRLKSAEEREFLNKMWQSEHLHSAFDASVFAGDGLDRTNAIVRQFTDAMEANNRLSTALAAYRLEKGMHKDSANALAYSRRVIEESHGVFSPTNTAPLFKNPLLRPMLQFHQQPMNLAMMMYRNMAKAAPKMAGGEANTEARWTLAYQLTTAAALGGMGGMPLDVPKMAAIASMPLGGPSPDDWNDMTQRFLTSVIGETGANIVQEGLPSLAGQYGPSLGHRAGYDAGFIYGSPESGSAADMLSFAAKQAAGAGPSMALQWVDAFHNIEQGKYQEAFENALPGSLKDIAKAYRLSTQGQTTRSGKVIYPGSVGDTIQQLLGFSSLERERAQAGHHALQKELQSEKNVGDQLKAKHKERATVLGVPVSKKQKATADEYERAYQ